MIVVIIIMILFNISRVKSRIAGADGAVSATVVVVDSNGLLSTTSPVIVETIISPDEIPFTSGKSTTSVFPNSSTVTVKSVPLIPIDAVGVLSLIFSLSTLPMSYSNFTLAPLIINFLAFLILKL